MSVTPNCRDNCPLNGLSMIRQGEVPSEAEEAAKEALFQKMQKFCPVLQMQRLTDSESEMPLPLEERRLAAAVEVVDLFDQANTGRRIESLGDRGTALKHAVEDLRTEVNFDQQRTILNSTQVNS
jgi:hypothetical protein